MKKRLVTFPFVPKSTSYLEPGFFWPIRLSNGSYSAATVLFVGEAEGDPWAVSSTRIFTAGLLSWTGASSPTSESLAGADLLDWGSMHVSAIMQHDEKILGRWSGIDSISSIQKVSHRPPGNVVLYTNGRFTGRASAEQARSLPVDGTWGLDFLWLIAERVHVGGLPRFET